MKRFIAIFFLIPAVMAQAQINERATRGVVHDWRIAPLQTGIGYNEYLYLFDGSANAVVILTLFGVEQRSGVVSLTGLNAVKRNYGIQVAWLVGESEDNFGISLGPVICTDDNFGLSVGLFNCLFQDNYGIHAGAVTLGHNYRVQICGVDLADTLRIAIANLGGSAEKSALEIGVFNAGDAPVQIGILNYHRRGLIPWFPLFNFGWYSEVPPGRQ